MASDNTDTPEARARRRAKNVTDLLWHVSTYVIVNAFLWTLDLTQGGGAEWAYWVSITWGIGLLFHIASYFLEENGFGNRRYERYLAEERERDADA